MPFVFMNWIEFGIEKIKQRDKTREDTWKKVCVCLYIELLFYWIKEETNK